ncbi:hypothetical protein AAHH88_00685 [Candidatus Hodgkinia cicadicola]
MSHSSSKFYVEFNSSKTLARFLKFFGFATLEPKVGALASNVRITCVDVDVSAIQKARASAVPSSKAGVRFVSADVFAYWTPVLLTPLRSMWLWLIQAMFNGSEAAWTLAVSGRSVRNVLKLVCLGLYSGKLNSFGVHTLVKLAVPSVVLIRERTNSG